MRIVINDVAADFRRFEGRTSVVFAPAREAVRVLAKAAKVETKEALRGKRTGSAYGAGVSKGSYILAKIGARRRALKTAKAFKRYIASAPGEAPAQRTGILFRSIRSARVSGGRSGQDRGFQYFIFADRRVAFYQRFLEFGTKRRRRGGKVAPRPLFTVLNARYQLKLEADLGVAIEAGLRELVK